MIAEAAAIGTNVSVPTLVRAINDCQVSWRDFAEYILPDAHETGKDSVLLAAVNKVCNTVLYS